MKIDFEKFQVNEEERTIVFSCASDTPYTKYEQYLEYDQILIINQSNVDLSRLNNSAPLLYQHDMQQLIGVIEKAWIQKNKIYVKARFSKNCELAERVYRDILDGIIKNISIGYTINHYTEKKENGRFKILVDDFTIYEVSIVSAAADITVGFRSIQKEKNIMDKKQIEELEQLKKDVQELKNKLEEKQEQIEVQEEKQEQIEVQEEKQEQIEVQEENQEQEIKAIAQNLNISEQETRSAIAEKLTIKQFKNKIKNTFLKKDNSTMNKREFTDYLMQRNFEKPFTLRDFSGFAPTALVASETLPLVACLAKKLGVQGFRTLTGLNGNINIPVQKTRNAVAVKGLNDSADDYSPEFENKTLSPVKITGSTVIGKELLVNSNSDVEAFIIDSITKEIAYKVESYMLEKVAEGAGKTITLNGLNNIKWQDVLAFEASLGSFDLGATNFVMSASARATLKGIAKGDNTAARFICQDNQINGYGVNVSGCVANDNIYFGDFSKLILGVWGEGLEILVDPYTEGRAGNVVIVGSICIDSVVEQADAFAVGKIQA